MLLMKNQTVHLREDVKFDFNDDVKQCNLDLQRDYLKIIKDATSGMMR